MFDPVIAFFQRVFSAMGRTLAAPFVALSAWFRNGRWVVKGPIALIILLFVGLYGYFFWQTQSWTNFDPDYVSKYNLASRKVQAGAPLNAPGGAPVVPAPADATTGAAADAQTEQLAAMTLPAGSTCQTSATVDVTADLIDFEVNQNAWISSMLLYKLGLFGLSWDDTPWFDNKASFQRGVNQTLRRATVELVDSLGRMRGTSGINRDLQNARGNIQFGESAWYFGLDPFGPKTPTPSFYRAAMRDLQAFNVSLGKCESIFDARSDNLVEFLDRLSSDLGDTSNILRDRTENHSGGWFDTRADDRFWFSYGQLYAYYGILSATGADFEAVIAQRGLKPLWTETLQRLRTTLNIQPLMISNGSEGGFLMPSHLSTMGFHILLLRSNLVEMRDILAR